MEKKSHFSQNLLIPLGLLLPFFLGVQGGGFQLALFSVGKTFHLSNASMGSLVSVQYLAFIVGPLLISIIIDKVGKKKVAIFATLTFSLGCITLIFTPTILLFVVGIFIVGFGMSVCQSAMSSALSDAYQNNAGKYINMAQGFYSLGAVISPLILQVAMDSLGFTWKLVFIFSGGGLLFLTVPLFFTKFTEEKNAREKEKIHPFSLFSKKPFLLILIGIILYVSYESGAAFFFNSFFTLELQASDLSAFAISLFWSAMVITRFLGGMFHKYTKLFILGGFAGASISFLFLATSTNSTIALTCCFFLGLFSGPIWPTLLALATQESPSNSGVIASAVMCVSGIGGALSPLIMGSVADLLSIRASFSVLVVIALLGLLSVSLYVKTKTNKNA